MSNSVLCYCVQGEKTYRWQTVLWEVQMPNISVIFHYYFRLSFAPGLSQTALLKLKFINTDLCGSRLGPNFYSDSSQSYI